MNFGAARLGFWYKRINRDYKKRILCFYDPLTNGPGGDTDYYSGLDRNPDTDLYPVIEARGTALGFEVSLVSSYSVLNTLDLAIYSQIWDLGYASPYTTNPNNPIRRLTQYLQGGGSMFILGENSAFQPRDNAIGTFIEGLGGGSGIVEGSEDYNYSRTLTLKSQFFINNSNSQVAFARPGVFTNIGNGTVMTEQAFPVTGELYYPAVVWTAGNLTGAPNGTVMSILDLNFIVGVFQNFDFIDNVIGILNRV
jgi:hypothetical protein